METTRNFGAFESLAEAAGLIQNGQLKGEWFQDPMGSPDGSERGLSSMVYTDEQREALLVFIDEVLGAPDRETQNGAVWAPLFKDSGTTIFVVVEEADNAAKVGFGVEYESGTATPAVFVRAHVPVFQFPREGSQTFDTSGDQPNWLVLGREDAAIEFSLGVTISNAAPVPGELYIGGILLTASIPTHSPGNLSLGVSLERLQLPGTHSPKDFELTIDSLNELGSDFVEFLFALLQAQADALDLNNSDTAPFAALSALLGLRVVSNIPALPLEDFINNGVSALIEWLESIFSSTSSRNAWLAQLAVLFGGRVNSHRSSIEFSSGSLTGSLGIRISDTSGGSIVITPWLEAALRPRIGAEIRIAVDLLTTDTATGDITAVPALSATAHFGREAGLATDLLVGDPGIASLLLGITLVDGQPAFMLTAHDVTLGNASHEVLDLSSPEAVLDATSTLIDSALTSALTGLGRPGELVAIIIGLQPPTGITAFSSVDLISNPLGALQRYWQSLVATPIAFGKVIQAVRELLNGSTTELNGTGSEAAPWLIELGAANLQVYINSNTINIDLVAEIATRVFDDFEAVIVVRGRLVQLELNASSVHFFSVFAGALQIRKTDRSTARFDLGAVDLLADTFGAELAWSARDGLLFGLIAPDLVLELEHIDAGNPESITVSLPVPVFSADGNVSYSPNWDEIELALASLLSRIESPVVDVLLDLSGWSGEGAHLQLSGLIANPETEIRSWLADLVLDCNNVRIALSPLAYLLSAFHLPVPLGSGNENDPYRVAIAGEPKAPGIAVWLNPGCPLPLERYEPSPGFFDLGEPPEEGVLVAALHDAARALPEIDDLLIGRDSLEQGLQSLGERFVGTDGLLGQPLVLPDGVTGFDLHGYSYRELVALGAIDTILLEALDSVPSAIMYIGCEELWADNFSANSLDARVAIPTQTIAATGGGPWSLALPLPADAEAARPDRGAVREQAERLIATLVDRTEPVTLVAYGAAGAAAIKAAETTPIIERVITVGSPWSPVAISAVISGLSGDALRFLQQIRRPVEDELDEELLANESGPLLQIAYVIDRAVAAAGFTDSSLGTLPLASEQTRRAGLVVDAIFGHLNSDDIDTGLAYLIADAIDYRYERYEAPEQPPQELHMGVDLPVFDLDLSGLLVGAGATIELVSFDRGEAGDSFRINNQQQLILDLHFGVHDGWLAGGPGALQNDVEVRWMSARIYLPLAESSTVSAARFTFHEANCFGIKREHWVVENDASHINSTLPTPEVHLLMQEVISRISSASTDLTQLLVDIGLVRAGGYDPQGLDRLIFDTELVITGALNISATSIAGVLRSLGGFGGSDSNVEWSIDAATVAFDLQTRSIDVNVIHEAGNFASTRASVSLNTDGLSVSAALGDIQEDIGGIQLLASFDTATTLSNSLGIDWQLPGSTAISSINLLSTDDLDELIRLVASLVPASLATGFLNMLRQKVESDNRTEIENLLDSLRLLGPVPEFGERRILVPWALFINPAAWLQHAASPWVSDPFGQAVNTLDLLAQVAAPSRTEPGWPISEEVTLTYTSVAGQLSLGIEIDINHALDASTVELTLAGGLSITGHGSSVLPQLATAVSFDGRGLALVISPSIKLDLLRPNPVAPMPIYPSGPGLSGLLSTGAGMAIPLVLDALIAERNNAGASIHRDVGRLIFDIGHALNLLESNNFSESKISSFANDPVSAFVSNLPALTSTAIAQLATALDPSHSMVAVINDGAGRTRLDLGVSADMSVTLDAGSSGPAIEIAGEISITDVGTFALDKLRLSNSGLQLTAHYTGAAFDVGHGLKLMPVTTVRAGVTSGGFSRLIGVGLAVDGVGDNSVEFRWDLNDQPPRIVLVDRTISSETENSDIEDVALVLLSQTISMAAGIALEGIGEIGDTMKDVLQNVIFTNSSTTLDNQLFADFSDSEALLQRFYQLIFNLAETRKKITIDGSIDIGFTKNADDHAGFFLSLPPGQRISLASGDPTVDLEIVTNWVNSPDIAPGFSVFLLEKKQPEGGITLKASFAIAGLGVRVAKNAGPLLDLGIMNIDAIGVHVYGEASPVGLGGGVHVQLDGLAIVPSAAGGDNAVANNFMSDAGADASPSARPAFSPSLAIQKMPGEDLGISLRAGDPPGPWWLSIQRQLGPLYLEQFGFDATEVNGTVTGLSLLFDASVSLFGLSAEMDQLGLHWLGGDVFDLQNWAVDLQGLGVSGDFSGLSISGGLLKTNIDGNTGYIGMLMGRFGVYGLSLFGGYNDDNGLPSFFVFGAIQGPIGGPPAFFLTGLGGGLGIKRGLRVPDDFSKFGEYPFIKALDPATPASTNPLAELRQLAEYFPPEPGNFWFAAGVSFTCFSLVDGIAVVSVSIGDGLDINLFGLARMALPRPQTALVSIELGLLARFSTAEGLFLIQAQLTDNSWLLYPEVRLTGGFAFATWWKGDNAGQFVITLGGYHPSFSRNGYPIVPRLGLEWRVSDSIVIKGASYFALTSEALMVGVDIEVSADFGFIWAKISFGANAIVYFDPFYFIADAYARIAAGIKIKTFFGTIRISISIGARIEVEGPNFHGRAMIEVGPCDITVRFGNTSSIRGIYMDWSGFVPKYLEENSTGRARAISGICGKGTLPAATNGDTSAPSSDGSMERPFQVFSEFEISIVTTVPVTQLDFGHTNANRSIIPRLPNGKTTGLGISPMNASNLDSTLLIRLEKKTGNRWVDRSADMLQLVKGISEDTGEAEGANFGLEAFPIGVWGLPEDTGQPSTPIPKGDVVFAASRLKLVSEASVEGQAGPEIDYYRVESGRKSLPLSAAGTQRGTFLNQANSLGVSEIVGSIDDAFLQAEHLLFVEHSTTEGMLDYGARSGLAKAAYKQSRTAPPLFGTLMDGLEEVNDDNVVSTIMTEPSPILVRQPRTPFITGYMTSGAGVTERKAITTVANQRIKRRPAPSLDSVRGRLGWHLPIRMHLNSAPPKIDDNTVIVRGTVPRTDLGSVTRSYQGGHVGSSFGGVLVKGLSVKQPLASRTRATPLALEPGSQIRAGDIISLRLPDAAIDTSNDRPSLKIEGDSRVVMLGGNGAVLVDREISNEILPVPKHTAIVAVQAAGAQGDISGQEAAEVFGWHDQSRIARLGDRSAIAAGCVINIDGVKAKKKVAWSIAADAMRGTATVSTRFATSVRSVGVVLRGVDARNTDDLGIELYGASRVAVDGQEVSPVVVQVAGSSIILFEVLPDTTGAAISIRITQGGNRQVSGVIGSMAGVDELADLVAEKGLLPIVARLRAAQGAGCSLEWISPQAPGNGGGDSLLGIPITPATVVRAEEVTES